MYSPVNFEDSRSKTTIKNNKERIQNYIRDNNLQEIPYGELDEKLYPYYLDGTKYYMNNRNEIIRITLAGRIYTNGWLNQFR